MRLIIVRGPLGIGKTTIATELAQRLRGTYVSIDEVLEKHDLDKNISPESEGIPVDRFLQVNALIKPIIDVTINKGQPIILDGCFYYREPVDELEKWYPGQVSTFTLTAPLETCILRDAGRKNTYGEDAARAVYELVSRIHLGTDIDATKNIEDIVNTIIDMLKK